MDLKKDVFRANKALVAHGLVVLTWGNVSGIDRKKGLVAIKPSGVPYDELKPEKMVVLDLQGNVVEGFLNPSMDAATHLMLYRKFPSIGAVVHTHSEWATIWAQAGKNIPALGTTHADYFSDAIPCTRPMTREEIGTNYEQETGQVIIETFRKRDPMNVPGVLVHSHGPFAWGRTPEEAVQNALALEQVAKMAFHTLMLNPGAKMEEHLRLFHFQRKHGPNAYYGQEY
jgi:L-ribulose-5-phosphate 4-epimerase